MPIATPEVYAEMLDAAKAERVRVPGDQRVVVADAQRRAAGLRRGRLRRHHPGLDRRRRVPLRPRDQEHGHRLGRVRGVRRRGGQELPGQRRAAHRPLPEGQARRLRPPAAGHLRRAGRARRGAAVPVAHVGRLRRAARGEPPDRPGAARQVRRGAHHPRGRDRCRRRRGGRRRGAIDEQALHHPRGRAGHRRGARPRREGPLHDRADLRQRARRLQARQRQAPPGDPQEAQEAVGAKFGLGAGRSRSTWSSTAARARLPRRSARPSTTAW